MTRTNSNSKNSDRGSGKLQGKTAILTSGNSGIERVVALTFAREAADVLMYAGVSIDGLLSSTALRLLDALQSQAIALHCLECQRVWLC
ncbi:MAG: hypothetical protein RMY64_10025 [Nostoc sp. DedQUE08]|uniref:hypothetical protein n=1 Tax=Nostoc sp. DedQUE08 TaxID=3075393 RepID=UPI002AD448E5|nr:hypothetical protein [Nostoc sp. DedQUE08]MDZ8065965.1 hypothetical protein [Nostoc sp. DedQUE08]